MTGRETQAVWLDKKALVVAVVKEISLTTAEEQLAAGRDITDCVTASGKA